MKRDLYAEVTNQILSMLEQGVVPWRCPILGRSGAGHPINLITDKPYRGINVFLLAFMAWSKGYGSAYWLTFNQAKTKGGSVKKGEKSSLVVFWKQYETEDEETGDPLTIPVLRYYNVFNAEQCDGLRPPDAVSVEQSDFNPIESADAIVKGFEGAPTIEHIGDRAFYRPLSDTVRIPIPTRFSSSDEYYSTLFHELAHSTGHSTRLARKLDPKMMPFGSSDYGKEELLAEMAAAFLCGEAGIKPAVIENQAAYINGWMNTLRGDERLVIHAAGGAQKAADWIRGERHAPSIKSERPGNGTS